MRSLAILFVTAVCTAATASAASLTIINPGFESDEGVATGNGGWSDAAPTGWSDPQGGDNTNFIEVIGGFASEGVVHLGFDGNEFGLVYQDLGVAWEPNTQYTLTLGVGNRAGFGAGMGRFGFGTSLDVLPPAGPAGGPFSLHTPSVNFTDLATGSVATTEGAFADAVFTYTTGAVAPLGDIRISIQGIDGTRIHVDNVRLDAVQIPEASSLAFLGLTGTLLLRRRRG